MRVVILAATYERGLNSQGVEVARPLLDLEDKPLLTILVERLSKLSDLSGIHVVTNERIKSEMDKWASHLPENFKKVNVISDGTNKPEEAIGAIGDLIFTIKKREIKEDLLVIGGDNWFTYDIGTFVQKAIEKSPSVVLTPCPEELNKSRFGIAFLDKEGRIVKFVEKPESIAGGYKASCVYYFSAGDLQYLDEFGRNYSTNCVPGKFLEWLISRISVYGVVMKATWYDITRPSSDIVKGPDFINLRKIIREQIQAQYGSSWERQAAKELAWISSYEDLLEVLYDYDNPNRRIMAVRILGLIGSQLSDDGKSRIIDFLLPLLTDHNTTNQYEYGSSQFDEDEVVYLWVSAADSLVKLGYAESRADVVKQSKESQDVK